jgi:hypothetical protein
MEAGGSVDGLSPPERGPADLKAFNDVQLYTTTVRISNVLISLNISSGCDPKPFRGIRIAEIYWSSSQAWPAG